MRKRSAFLLAFASAALSAGHPHPDTDIDAVDYTDERAAIEKFQQLDQRLHDTGWKLVRGNARFCAITLPSIGLQLQDLASYGRPDIARAALGMTGDFAVQTAAKGSPAEQTATFKPNREVTLIGALDPNSWEAAAQHDWRRLKRAHDAIDDRLREASDITVTFADGESVRVFAEPVCATRFELAAKGSRAIADGERVVIGAGFAGFAMEDDLFAAAIAHELAHNLLGHRAWLDTNGRRRKNIRATEREADRLMGWLLANAGYDPAASVRFFERYRPSSGSVLFIRGSHDKWSERAEAAARELPLIATSVKRSGGADWASDFTREIDRAPGR